MTNRQIAERLLEHARGLRGGAHFFRARAYRRAAMVVQGLDRPVTEYLRDGRSALARLPDIGAHLAFTIETLVNTGKFVTWSERKSFAVHAA